MWGSRLLMKPFPLVAGPYQERIRPVCIRCSADAEYLLNISGTAAGAVEGRWFSRRPYGFQRLIVKQHQPEYKW